MKHRPSRRRTSGRDTDSVRARGKVSEPRTLARYRREVVALLAVGHRIPTTHGLRLLKKWDAYVQARWRQGRPPCNVADHLSKFERERIVKPYRDPARRRGKTKTMSRLSFMRQMRPVKSTRRHSRDAENPRSGEIFETKAGNRWEVVDVTDRLIKVKRAGNRTDGPFAWGRKSLSGMKEVPRPLFGVGGLFGIGAGKPANATQVGGDPERRRRARRRRKKTIPRRRTR